MKRNGPLRLATGTLLILASVAVSAPAAGQERSNVLSGVDSVNAVINLTWDDQLPVSDKNTIQARLQTVFELELRTHGIIISKTAATTLELRFAVLSNQAGTAASYSYAVDLVEAGVPNRVINHLMAEAAVRSIDTASLRRPRADSARFNRELRARMWQNFWAAWAKQPRSTWVMTWEGPTGVGFVGSTLLRETLERKAIEAAQAFANDFMASRKR